MFYIDDFLSFLKTKRYNVKNTIKAYRHILKEFEAYCYNNGVSSVKQLTERIIIEYLEYLQHNRISERYFILKISRLRIYFHFLYEKGYVFFDFLKDYPIRKYLRNHHPVLSQKEITNIIENIIPKDTLCHKGKAILELMYSSALRPSEVCKLQISDIDFKGHQLFIKQSKQKKDRIVPVGKVALDVIADYIESTRIRYLKPGSPDNIFLSFKSGKPHNAYGIRWIIRETLIRNGFKPLRPYSLRGTSATVLFLNGMSVAYLSKLLGHTEFRTTSYYIQVNEINLKSVLQKHHPRLKLNTKEETQ